MRGCLAYRGYDRGRGRRFCLDSSLSQCRLRSKGPVSRSAQNSISRHSCPASFVLGIVAGVPAAAFAALLTIPLVWWAFMPPFFELHSLTSAHAEFHQAVLPARRAGDRPCRSLPRDDGDHQPRRVEAAERERGNEFAITALSTAAHVACGQQSGNHSRLCRAALTFRKRFGRNFSPGNDEGVFGHERPNHRSRHLGERAPLPRDRIALSPDRCIPPRTRAGRCSSRRGIGKRGRYWSWKPISPREWITLRRVAA